MNILAIDTATEACSVGLLMDQDRDGIFELCPQQHSQRILPMIDEVLTRNGLSINDIDALAYGRGPGSFTGVRIAASTIQGLALGAHLKVVEISTLACMAQENFERFGKKHTLALIDARMQEVYCGKFVVDVAGVVSIDGVESVMPPSMVAKSMLAELDETAFVGTGFHAYAQELGLTLQSSNLEVNYPNALYMLNLANYALAQGNAVDADEVAPVYVRDTVTWKKLPNKA